jgi:glycosyltransferase involved in cell wall biosynthesis
MVQAKETTSDRPAEPLRILHVFRAPVGGLFRHVVDLSREQAARGHKVGLVTDSTTGGEWAQNVLDGLAPSLHLGCTRMPMRRLPHFSDLTVTYKIANLLRELQPDVVHGHGAKGGLYARLPWLLPFFPKMQRPILRAYTPHGGSLHYDPDTLINRSYISVERMLEHVTDLIPFESEYARNRFVANVGLSRAMAVVVPNGIGPEEFEPVTPAPDAADFLYVGELRERKGVDLLIKALAMISARLEVRPTLVLVGSGPDEKIFRSLGKTLNVAAQMRFEHPMPARKAFRLGRIIVQPSRAESLPYVVLEAVGAQIPIVATRVGGTPEIFGLHASRLTPVDDAPALADAMLSLLQTPDEERMRVAREMASYVHAHFTLKAMAEGVLRAYREAAAFAAHRSKRENTTPMQI